MQTGGARASVEAAKADTAPTRALSELIGSIYDCVLDPGRWERTLADLRDAFECANALLALSDVRNGRMLISKSAGIEPYWQERISAHAPEINSTLAEALAGWPDLDQPFVISRNVAPAAVEASPYFQECYRGQGLIDALQYFLVHTPERFSGFALGRHEQRGLITDRETELGAMLLPHIRRAVTISDVLDVRTIERARMEQTLDALQCGVVLADENARILHANRAAEEMLRTGEMIAGAGGVLSAKEPAANKELSLAIRLAAQDEAKIGKAGLAVRLARPDGPPRLAHVLPMGGSEMRTQMQASAAAAVFIAKPDHGPDAARLAAAFDLTPAETAVLVSLLAGRTREETAAALDISLSTAKTHLLNIFAKTGVRRQAELILLASRAFPPTSEGR